MFVARKNSRTTTAACVSAQFRLLSPNGMTAIIVAALPDTEAEKPRDTLPGDEPKRLGLLHLQVLKLMAKRPRRRCAMPIQTAGLLFDVLFDFSADFLGNLRRQKNSFDDLGRRTRSLVAVEQHPGRASAHPKDSGLLRGRIITSSHKRLAYLGEL